MSTSADRGLVLALLVGVVSVGVPPLVGCATRSRTVGDAEVKPEHRREASTATMRTVELTPGVTMTFVQIPPGSCIIGSAPDAFGHRPDESPQRAVQIPQALWVGQTEVTQRQWQALEGNNPSWYPGDELPVNRISWYDANDFCRRLSAKYGCVARLPTEAEWEYICRAGTQTPYPFGEDATDAAEYGWFQGDSQRQPNPVAQKKPTRWGLYDIHGNVWEWCADHYALSLEPIDETMLQDEMVQTHRVLRGGSWFEPVDWCRCASRIGRPGSMRSGYIGMRVIVEQW